MPKRLGYVMRGNNAGYYPMTLPPKEQEGQHPLIGQRAVNFRLLANQ